MITISLSPFPSLFHLYYNGLCHTLEYRRKDNLVKDNALTLEINGVICYIEKERYFTEVSFTNVCCDECVASPR
ncbi:hypothetical protein SAMN04489735_100226 [Aneurinibacillus thermoaerophilus]|uniref:Uncharacterized protein n=1 Tax=Aneurinibacillus thermoaerophilus TaxID=143495 RepID=A0A1G7WNK3_ANETH|nr:hypothetical protein SAMN04489735_100226 [Aneurinibacillus thermoaerophilus]